MIYSKTHISKWVRLMSPVIILLALSVCQPDDAFTDSNSGLKFSSDTVSFDTIFTTVASATQIFKVYNPYHQQVLITNISLAGGEQSSYRLNIDGEDTWTVSNKKLSSKDSLYIFIEVTIDPLNSDNPLIIKDSIMFVTNGNRQYVNLIAYGQDAIPVNGEILESQTWTNAKPYLLYNTVVIDTGETLVVEKGCKLYFHKNANLIVRGKLIINGSLEDPVVLQNDRPEEFYDAIPGQWGTVFFDPISTGNVINHAIIKNSISGLHIGFPSDYHIPSLELSNTVIQNVSFAGIYAFGADISCYNTVIANCGGPALALLRGGNYRFLHCTVSNNGVIGTSRTGSSVKMSNEFYNPEYEEETGNLIYRYYTGHLESAEFHNCIIYGNLIHELDLIDNGEDQFVYSFDHSLIKASELMIDINDTIHFHSVILNEDPVFINDSSHYYLDLQLDTLSPAKDAGDSELINDYPLLEYDMNGQSRIMDNGPDLGAYERLEY